MRHPKQQASALLVTMRGCPGVPILGAPLLGGQVTKISFTLTQSLSWPQEGDFIQYLVYLNSFASQTLHIGDADSMPGPVLAYPAVGLREAKDSIHAPKSKEKYHEPPTLPLC